MVAKPRSSGWRCPAGQAVVAAGHRVPAEGDEIEHLAEGDRHHREIDAAQPNDQRADDRGRDRADGDADQRCRGACSARRYLMRHADAIGAEAEIGGVAERQHAGEAEQEIERHRRQRQHDDAAAELGVAADRRQPVGHRQQQQPDQRRSALAFRAGRSLEPPFLAEQAARADQQHQRHHDVDHRLGRRGKEHRGRCPRRRRSAGRRAACPAGCRGRRR